MGAGVVAAVAAVAGAAAGIYQGEKQRKLQKKEAREQQKAINEQKKQALADRTQQINQMRMQMAGTGEGTRGTSTSGVTANIGGARNGNTLG